MITGIPLPSARRFRNPSPKSGATSRMTRSAQRPPPEPSSRPWLLPVASEREPVPQRGDHRGVVLTIRSCHQLAPRGSGSVMVNVPHPSLLRHHATAVPGRWVDQRSRPTLPFTVNQPGPTRWKPRRPCGSWRDRSRSQRERPHRCRAERHRDDLESPEYFTALSSRLWNACAIASG
jgi:hypothetical protein